MCLSVCLYAEYNVIVKDWFLYSLGDGRSTQLLSPEKKNITKKKQSAGLEPVLSHTEKSCIASYYRQLSKNIKINIKIMLELIPVLTKMVLIFISAESCL